MDQCYCAQVFILNLQRFVSLMQYHLSSRVKLNIRVIIFNAEWHVEKIFLMSLKVTGNGTFIICALLHNRSSLPSVDSYLRWKKVNSKHGLSIPPVVIMVAVTHHWRIYVIGYIYARNKREFSYIRNDVLYLRLWYNFVLYSDV